MLRNIRQQVERNLFDLRDLLLEKKVIDGKYIGDIMAANALVGVPYTEDMLANAQADFAAQADPDSDYDGLLERYGDKVNVRNFDGKPGVTEMEALVAYMQMLGTLVDFSTFNPDQHR